MQIPAEPAGPAEPPNILRNWHLTAFILKLQKQNDKFLICSGFQKHELYVASSDGLILGGHDDFSELSEGSS